MERPEFIGVCLSTLHEEDRFNFIEALNKHVVANGYRLLVFNSCSDLYDQSKADNEGSSAVFRLLPFKRLAAVVIMPNIMYDPIVIKDVIRSCHEHNVPIISIDKEIKDCISISFTYSDVFERLCRHVIEDHGARDLCMIAGFKENVYSEERIAAFKKALAVNNIPFNEEDLGYGCFWEQPTIEVLTEWFVVKKRKIPDAIICANDFMAITTSSFLQNMGVKVPQDCIVTGFDGIRQAEYLPPSITTCKQDFDQMGSLIVDVVNRLREGKKVENSYKVDFKIVYSQSCGCEPVGSDHTGAAIRSLLESLRLSDERQKMLTYALNYVPRIGEIHYLFRMLMDKFRVNTCICALNEDVFEPPDYGSKYRGSECFSKNSEVIFHRYDRKEYPQCTIPTDLFIPRVDLLMENTDPLVVCCANFTDLVMGYCIFQTKIDIDEYDKMHSLMAAIGSSLGSYNGRMQIKNMNSKLMGANEELERISQRDYMTGMFNRRGFFKKLEEEIGYVSGGGSTLLFISADLDGLKYINDNFGHSEGDNAIITVGKALLSSSLGSEICARFGGDEFGVAVNIGKEAPARYFGSFKERFMEYLDNYNRSSDKPYKVQASIGFHYDIIDTNLDTDEIIKAADEMMYAYKQEHKRMRR